MLMFLKRPMQLQGDESLIHAALIQKLSMIMQTPAAVPPKPDKAEPGDMNGFSGEHRES